VRPRIVRTRAYAQELIQSIDADADANPTQGIENMQGRIERRDVAAGGLRMLPDEVVGEVAWTVFPGHIARSRLSAGRELEL
jgi:hypothetical protein